MWISPYSETGISNHFLIRGGQKRCPEDNLKNNILRRKSQWFQKRKNRQSWKNMQDARVTQFIGGTGCSSYSKNSGAYRAFTDTSQRSSFQKRSSEDGWSEKRSAGIPEENRHRKIPCTDWKIRFKKIISMRTGRITIAPFLHVAVL